MALESKKSIDDVGWQLLQALQEDARLSFAELGRRVGLSLPAVAERVRRLEEAGIISGYHTEVNLPQAGLPIMAFIRINVPGERYPQIIALARDLPEILECHHLSGSDSFILKVVAASIPHLEVLITRLSSYGQTTTSIVLSSPVTKRVLAQKSGYLDGAQIP
jgi:Lrp/AsnC family leucine-responsive transcriptional regulator